MTDDSSTYDDWEQLADSKELDQPIKKKMASNEGDQKDEMKTLPSTPSFQGNPNYTSQQNPIKILQRPNNNMNVLMKTEDLSIPVRNTPTFKILKRPSQKNEDEEKDKKEIQTPKIKTLQQREVEYQRARQRIMGQPPTSNVIRQDNSSNGMSNNNNKRFTNNNNKSNVQQQQQQQQPQTTTAASNNNNRNNRFYQNNNNKSNSSSKR